MSFCRFLVIALLATSLGPIATHGALETLSESDLQLLGRRGNFAVVSSVDQLPTALRELCGDHGRMANPGQPWSGGCLWVDGKPRARLIWAARFARGRLWVICCERGGQANWAFCDLFLLDKFGQPVARWRAADFDREKPTALQAKLNAETAARLFPGKPEFIR